MSFKQALKNIKQGVSLSYNLAVAYYNNQQMDLAREVFEEIYPEVTDEDMKSLIEEYLERIKKRNP